MTDIQYYNHMFLGAVTIDGFGLEDFLRVVELDPNQYLHVTDRDGQPATARAAQLEPIIMQDPTPSGVSGEEINIVFPASLPVSEVVEGITAELRADELVEFIKILDERAQDWYVTEKLFEHFSEQHEIFMKEEEDNV